MRVRRGPPARRRDLPRERECDLPEARRRGTQAGWVYSTYITQDTEALNARANQALLERARAVRQGRGAVRQGQCHAGAAPAARPAEAVARAGDARRTPKEAEELTKLAAGLEATYGKGKWCKDPAKPDTCLDIEKITEILAKSRDEKEIREAWEGWHTIAVPMRKDYTRFVELANKGAQELGFADTGAMWRLKYDMPADDFTKEVDRLWEQVRPLYVSLHAYVRMKLHEKYGDACRPTGRFPRTCSGNIWAQDWSNVFDLVAAGSADAGLLAHRHPEAPQDVGGRHGEDGRALLHVARLRAAAEDVLGAVAVREAGRPRRGLPRERVGHRLRGRPAHQDVHRSDRGGLLDDPPRARAQLLSARLQGSAGAVPRQRESGVPRSDRRHDRAVGDAGVPRQDRVARQGAGRVARHRPAAVARAREDRVPAVRPRDRSVALGSVFRAR